MDVCARTGWSNGCCHPDSIRGCCILLLNEPQLDYSWNHYFSGIYAVTALLHVFYSFHCVQGSHEIVAHIIVLIDQYH